MIASTKTKATKEPAAPRAPRPPRAPKPAAKPKTNAKSKKLLAKINARALATKEWADGLTKVFFASTAEKGTALERYIGAIGAALEALHTAAADISAASFDLAQAGWTVPFAGVYRPGELVTLREGRLERYTDGGAYTAEDLAELAVLSIHGRLMKVKTGKNECLGLIPMTWFRRVDQKA